MLFGDSKSFNGSECRPHLTPRYFIEVIEIRCTKVILIAMEGTKNFNMLPVEH
jgi:hypothetical protein